jgi:hypothetical protein
LAEHHEVFSEVEYYEEVISDVDEDGIDVVRELHLLPFHLDALDLVVLNDVVDHDERFAELG